MKAMILAAGFGTRLTPYSLLRPKPLFPVLNSPLLLQTVQRLQRAGFCEIGINCHHLAPQVIELVGSLSGVRLFHEETVLGTGGGLKNAHAWFGHDSVLVTNGDIFHDLDFAQIMAFHKKQENLATLVCHDYPRFNKVSLGADQLIKQFSPCEQATSLLAFTGVHVFEPHILSTVSSGFSSVIDCYSHWLERGARIQAMVAQGHFWMDMGTPADYLDLHGILLHQTENPLLVHSSVDMTQATCKDWVAVGENAVLGAGCQLERVVVWDGAVVEPCAHLKDTIIT